MKSSNKIISTRRYIVVLLLTMLALLVASVPSIAVQAAPEKKKQPSGILLLYNEGPYRQAVIQYIDSNVSTPADGSGKCGSKTFKDNGNGYKILKVNFKKGVPVVKQRCTAANYRIYFLKQGEKSKDIDFQAVDSYASSGLTANYCSFVHKAGVTRNENIDKDGKCKGDNNPDETKVKEEDRLTPAITAKYEPATLKSGQTAVWTVELTLPKPTNPQTLQPLSPEECAGSFNSQNAATKNNREFPLRYSPKTKSCVYKVKFKTPTIKADSEQKGTVTFSGNKFLKPATYEHTFKIAK